MIRTLPLLLFMFALGCPAPRGGRVATIDTSRLPPPPQETRAPQAPEQPTAATTTPAAPPRGAAPEAAGSQSASDQEVKAALDSINKLLDAYFDFNAYLLRPDAIEAVTQSAAVLKQHLSADPSIKLIVEGHCDERGSAEFNLALGDRRAESVRELLAQLGIDGNRITTMSYGEARPQCGDATEEYWQKNRRAHIRHER